jgi:hypothetical protein
MVDFVTVVYLISVFILMLLWAIAAILVFRVVIGDCASLSGKMALKRILLAVKIALFAPIFFSYVWTRDWLSLWYASVIKRRQP